MTVHLLTGAGSGIGAAVADLLTERGDDLVLLARSGERAEQLHQRYPRAQMVVLDLADADALDHADLTDLPPRLDSLLHAAGVIDLGPVSQLSREVWQRHMTVNLVAPAVLTRRLLPALRGARGQVVFVNSGSGLRVGPQWGAYGASKHALRALADALRAEEREHGVRVSSIYPGRTATAMQQRVHRQEGRHYDPADWIAPESVAQTVLTALDMPADAELTDLTVRPR